jgi:hypothetical protein
MLSALIAIYLTHLFFLSQFLSYYWVHQVLQNTMHVTTAGVSTMRHSSILNYRYPVSNFWSLYSWNDVGCWYLVVGPGRSQYFLEYGVDRQCGASHDVLVRFHLLW